MTDKEMRLMAAELREVAKRNDWIVDFEDGVTLNKMADALEANPPLAEVETELFGLTDRDWLLEETFHIEDATASAFGELLPITATFRRR